MRKRVSPTIKITLDPDDYERARRSHSGACLIADAIKAQYPHLTKVSVDMATIRVSDTDRGVRFVYLTPPEAQHVLLAYDQGWANPVDRLTVQRAVKVVPITRPKTGPQSVDAIRAKRQRAFDALKVKVDAGERLTREERGQWTKLQKEYNPPARPSSRGHAEVHANGGSGASIVIYGGKAPVASKHPNLLGGRNRHFGAKLANPGLAFEAAVEAAVAARFAERAAQETVPA